VEWYIGSRANSGWQTFIITQGDIRVETFPPEERDILRQWSDEYLREYDRIRQGESLTERQQRQKAWQESLAPRLQRLGEILRIEEILAEVPGKCDKLILVPHRFLHVFPLHAVPGCPPGDSREKRPLMDIFARGVSYVPSCQLLQRLHQRPPATPREPLSLFAVQNPTDNLPYADREVEQIAEPLRPNTYILRHRDATKTALSAPTTLARLQQSESLHFACHGSFNPANPLYSALILSPSAAPAAVPETPPEQRYLTMRDGRRVDTALQGLTLTEIFANLDIPCCRIVVLSACETGLVDSSQVVDEYIGLPIAFLYAGSATVISSLWSVDDFATAFLMVRFYRNFHRGTQSAVEALQEAQTWLRSVSREEFVRWLQEDLQAPEKLWKNCRTRLRRRYPDPPFAGFHSWAAFGSIGL
jgi:CHAT domain-containing protein